MPLTTIIAIGCYALGITLDLLSMHTGIYEFHIAYLVVIPFAWVSSLCDVIIRYRKEKKTEKKTRGDRGLFRR